MLDFEVSISGIPCRHQVYWQNFEAEASRQFHHQYQLDFSSSCVQSVQCVNIPEVLLCSHSGQ